MRKKILLPALTGSFSLLGLILRQLQLRTAFDVSGLPVDGAPATLALLACIAAFLICTGLLLLSMRGNVPALTFDEAFRCKNNTGYMMACVLTAAFLICGLLLNCLALVHHEHPGLLHMVLGLLMAASGVGLVLLGRNNYRDLGQGRNSGCLLLAAYTAAMWLILSYQQVSGDPILQNYIYRLLAIVFFLLAFYFMAGYAFEKGKPLATVWSSLCAVYFSSVTLLDDRDPAAIAYLTAFLLYFFVHSAVLLDHLTAEREESTDE